MPHRRQAQAVVRGVVIGIVVLACAAGGFGVYWYGRPAVTVTRVIEGPVISSFYATGTVQPVTEYPIKASNAGILVQVLVDKGDRVTRGQTLALVNDPQLQFKLDKAKAELQQAQERAEDPKSPVLGEFDAKLQANAAMLDNAHIEEKRYTEMFEKHGASELDRNKAIDHVKDLWSQGEALKNQRAAMKIQLHTDLQIAEAALAAAQSDLDRQTLRSPLDGVVLDRPVPMGTRLNVNDHVMQIADVRPENLRMRAAVDEENKAQLSEGQRVRMSLYSFPGRIFDGQVTRIYDQADADRRTFEVDVNFQPPEQKLSPGMTGELAFILSEKMSALVAPAQALQRGELYTVRDGKLARVAEARVGIRSVERIEILSGFHAGDTIVITPVTDLRDGTSVRQTSIDPSVAAGLNRPNTDSTQRNPLGGR